MRTILFLVIIFLVLFGIQMLFNSQEPSVKEGDDQILCTEDAFICPDGTAVGRVAPDCNFAPCPNGASEPQQASEQGESQTPEPQGQSEAKQIQIDERNQQRKADVSSILQSFDQFRFDLAKGSIERPASCTIGDPTTGKADIKTSDYNLAPCIVPLYLESMPLDPLTGYWNSKSDYISGYQIYLNGNEKVVVSAPASEGGEEIKAQQISLGRP